MTITHLSHFDVEMIAKTADSVVFDGTLAGCRKLAFSHGMEVEKYEGRIMSCDAGHAIYAPADASSFAICYFKGSGLIAKTRDGYSLVMPLSVWNND